MSDLKEPFVLRVYTRNNEAYSQEQAISKKFHKIIPTPQFLYASKEFTYPYAIQSWIEGSHLYKLFDAPEDDLKAMAKSVAHTLYLISRETYPKAGFFNRELEIHPFETNGTGHPFISYIEDCLSSGLAGKRLGEELKDKVWKCVEANREYFPKLEPACLVHGDFNFDNILIDKKTFKVSGILDWEFAFAGSYLFDIGTFLRFESPSLFETAFIENYTEEKGIKLERDWKRMIKMQDFSNLIGLLNNKESGPNLERDIKQLIEETLNAVTTS